MERLVILKNPVIPIDSRTVSMIMAPGRIASVKQIESMILATSGNL